MVNYDLSNFIDSCVSKDYNLLKYPQHKGKSYKKLYQSLSSITDALKKSEIETIFKSQYLYAAIQNVGAGLIWFNDKGEVLLVNKSAKELFNINVLSNIYELEKISKDLPNVLKDIRPSENKLVKIYVENDLKQISIKATDLIQQGKQIKLITLHDIKTELDTAELDSWQKLIRVLAHEIMNSIGPITTTTTAISKFFKNDQDEVISTEEINNTTIENTIKGLEIIEERSLGLKDFVGNYRQLSNLPKPNISEFQLKDFIRKLILLLKEELFENNIVINWKVQPDELVLMADEKLISHVILNLLKNSMEAVRPVENPEIDLNIYKNGDDEIVIQVSDNGSGISEELMDKIFIPFFTTKEEGSGIGLSLSRQIMRLHNGSIKVKSSQEGTVFQLLF